MTKNRSRSPVTGQRRLAKEPGEALAIRQTLAARLKELSVGSTADTDPFFINSSSDLLLLRGNVKQQISLDQIEMFGIELVSKEILMNVERHGDKGCLFIPTTQGRILIGRGSARLTDAPKAVFTTDLATRQKTMDRLAARALRQSTPDLTTRKRLSSDLPKAADLLVPILELALKEPVHHTSMTRRLAVLVGFPQRQIHLSKPIDTDQTFHLLAHHAVTYLLENAFLVRAPKTFRITPLGTATASFDGLAQWPDFAEPSVKKKARPISKPLQEGRRAHHSVEVDATRILKNLQIMDASKIIAIWKNAHRVLADHTRKDQHAEVSIVIEQLERERVRRCSNDTSEDFFKWPSTEARGGSGTLSLDDIEKNGLLSKFNYHVGRTNGEPEPFRRRTLTKIFENAFPSAMASYEHEEWGTQGSAKRLRKMAHAIASFTRAAKQRNPTMLDVAIREWEADLHFLYERYYVGKFGFDWPTTNVAGQV